MERRTEDKVTQWARRSASRERLKAMLDLAKPESAISHEDLDQDPWLFNCLNGTVDLRTGILMPHQPEHLITRLVPVEFHPESPAPTWGNFVDQIFAGNERISSYVQRFVGYSLTGLINEQCLAFLHGEGANGKTTFINAIREGCGDYAHEAAPDLLLDKKFAGIPNDIARLRGARFVTVTETAESRRFDEGLIKRLTGGDRITARYLRAEFFEFDPTHKLWLISNHKPIIRGQDHAIWRRIKLIPFQVTFRPEQQDRDLPLKLRAELPGILAWAVRGCLEWQREGLGEPDEVRVASDTYRTEMDVVGRFIAERCSPSESGRAEALGLYQAYRDWSEQCGERPMTGKLFGERMIQKGFERRHRADGNYYLGLVLSVRSVQAPMKKG